MRRCLAVLAFTSSGNSVWVRIDASKFGGNCNVVPLILHGN